jgi:hypothetical protein
VNVFEPQRLILLMGGKIGFELALFLAGLITAARASLARSKTFSITFPPPLIGNVAAASTFFTTLRTSRSAACS